MMLTDEKPKKISDPVLRGFRARCGLGTEVTWTSETVEALLDHSDAQAEEIKALKEPAPSPDLEKLVDEVMNCRNVTGHRLCDYQGGETMRKNIADVLRPLVEKSTHGERMNADIDEWRRTISKFEKERDAAYSKWRN